MSLSFSIVKQAALKTTVDFCAWLCEIALPVSRSSRAGGNANAASH
jgi:hypothetical protein